MHSINRITTVALIGLLVLSPVVGPITLGPTGTASAQSDCTVVDNLFGNCDPWDDPTEIIESNYDDKLDLYSDAKALEARAEVALDNYRNDLVSLRTQSKMAGEEAFVRAIYNGRSKAEAIQRSLDAVNDTYAVFGNQIIETQNNMVVTLYSIQQKGHGYTYSDGEAGKTRLVETHEDYPAIEVEVDDTDEWSSESVTSDITGRQQREITLPNGETKAVSMFELTHAAWGLDEENNVYVKSTFSKSGLGWGPGQGHRANGTVAIIDGTAIVDSEYEFARLTGPITANFYPNSYPLDPHKSSVLLDVEDWGQLWSDYNAQYQDDLDYMRTWANESYEPAVNTSDDIEMVDLLNKFSLIRTTADLTDQDNASFSDVSAALAAQGMATPGGETAYMTISYQTSPGGEVKTNDGLLASQSPPLNGSWQRERWYNASILPGAQAVVRLDGSVDVIKGDFRIEGVYDANGTEITDPTVEVSRVDWQTSNVTELRHEISNLSKQIEDIRNRTGDTGPDGGPGMTWPDLGIPNPLSALGALGQWVILAVIGFVVLLVFTVVN